MTAAHREQMLALAESLATELENVEAADGSGAENLRGAITAAGDVVRQRVEPKESENPDLKERLADLEEKVEMIALEHPVIANVLTAISRLG